MNSKLKQYRTALAQSFGKTTRWQLLCKEQHATSEEAQIKIAEQVLGEPEMGGVTAWWSHWARLNGAETGKAPPYDSRAVSEYMKKSWRDHADVKYKSREIASAFDLIDAASPLNPTSSEVPFLAYWSDISNRFFEFGNATGLPIPPNAALAFDFSVAPVKGRGRASQTDLMILSPSIAVGVEAKERASTTPLVSRWLGSPATRNRVLVLEGWLELINKTVRSSVLTMEDVQDIDYQLINRTAAACSVGAKRHAVVYQYFGSSKDHAGFYCEQLSKLARRVRSRSLSFLFFMVHVEKTKSYLQLERKWQNATEKPDVSNDIRQSMIKGDVATFSEPVVQRF